MTLKPQPARLAAAAVLLALTLSTTPAFGVNKEMVQLQTQIQQLQDAVARLQQSNDERMGVLKDLVQQSADSVNRMSLNMDALQKQMRTQSDAESTKLDAVSTQVQSLNDSLDEMKARIARLDKALQDIQSQQQSNAANAAAQPSVAPVTTPPLTDPVPTAVPTRRGKPSAAVPLSDSPLSADTAPATPQPTAAPPVDDLYRTALSDYMAAKYPLASAEFTDVIRSYPDHPLSGNAFYYLGEIDYRQGRYAAAAKDYDHVLEQFPGNSKIPAAHLHKGQALLTQKQTDAGVRELRALIARFPNSPEAGQARTRLSTLGPPTSGRR